jgi:hypothetical protein
MANEPSRSYGLSTNLFVSRKTGGEAIVIGGVAENNARWTRVLAKRAAQMLWFFLTRYLFPEKSDMVTGLASTAPMRAANLPTITTHMSVDKQDNTYRVSGTIGEQTWQMRLSEFEANRLWMSLDIALYPVGWKGEDEERASS